MSFDVARVRGLYPTLGAGIAHLDGNFSTLRSSPSQPGSRSTRSQRAAATVDNARRAIGDLVGASPDCVVLGANVPTLIDRFAGLIVREWQLGDEIGRAS